MPKESELVERRIQEALQCRQENPNRSISSLAKEYHVPYHRLRCRLLGTPSKFGRKPTCSRLSEAEEKALCMYIDRLDYVRLSVRRSFVENAANSIIQANTPDNAPRPPPVGQHWVSRFVTRHKYSVVPQKVLDADRQAAENQDVITSWFEALHKVIAEYGIVPEDIWNMDETGFRIGVGKDQLVITRRRRVRYFGLPTNRESATAIEAINAGGAYVPAFLILSGKVHMSNWYCVKDLEDDTMIALLDSGYSNTELSFQWLQHFHRHTQKARKGRHSLLIMDNHGSHHSFEFIEYCWKHNILPFGLPANLTHLLQPLDVVVFQPLKHYHAQALDFLVRDRITQITKLEFLGLIQDIRKKAFKESTIRSAFKKTGIMPFNPNIILGELRNRRAVTPPEQTSHQSSPFATPLTIRGLNKAADGLLEDLPNDASPTYAYRLNRTLYGARVQATQAIQLKDDLSRTRLAEAARKAARAEKNRQLQYGGIMNVEDARGRIAKRQVDDVEKAEAIVRAHKEKEKKAQAKTARAAAKAGRGRLKRLRDRQQLMRKLVKEIENKK